MAAHRDLGETYADRLGFLMRWSSILASCLDKHEIFEKLARAAVPYVADWCTIVIRDRQGRLQRVGVAHADPGIDRKMRQIPGDSYLPGVGARLGIPRALRTGDSELLKTINVEDVLKELAGGHPNLELLKKVSQMGAFSMMTTPLVAHGDVLGAMSLYNGRARPRFEAADLALAEELSRRAALTLFTLQRLESSRHEVEIFEHAMRIYRDFVVSRVEDARTPLTAGRLKVELLSIRGEVATREAPMLKKLLEDIDRAIMVITSLGDETVYSKLVAGARYGAATAAPPPRHRRLARRRKAVPSRNPHRGLSSRKRA